MTNDTSRRCSNTVPILGILSYNDGNGSSRSQLFRHWHARVNRDSVAIPSLVLLSLSTSDVSQRSPTNTAVTDFVIFYASVASLFVTLLMVCFEALKSSSSTNFVQGRIQRTPSVLH